MQQLLRMLNIETGKLLLLRALTITVHIRYFVYNILVSLLASKLITKQKAKKQILQNTTCPRTHAMMSKRHADTPTGKPWQGHTDSNTSGTAGFLRLDLWLSVLCMRSKAWLATRVSPRLARLPRTASSAQCSRCLCSTRAAVPDLLTHAEVTENNIFFDGSTT